VIDSQTIEQMTLEGNAQKAELEKHLDALSKGIHACNAELETLQQNAAKRAQQHSLATSQVKRAEDAHQEAANYAKLAHGTIHEDQSIKDTAAAKKVLEKASKELEQLGREQAKAEQAESAREQELRGQLRQLQAEKEARHVELQGLRKGLDRATNELGEVKHTERVAGYQEKRQQVDALLTQLIAAQVEAQQYYDESLTDLSTWPALQKDFALLVQPEDSTSRAIEAALFYVESLLRERAGIQELPADLKRRGFSLWDCVAVTQQTLLSSTWKIELGQYQQAMKRLLAEYRAYLAAR
jgi:DNA repair exonuclease SbcCD ATPase subunit